ncbi:MAG: hypothetical protein MI892_11745 [Desulfobacterales bacterium]|nr:hypothetical protein [Desulfobacterales bacterium]
MIRYLSFVLILVISSSVYAQTIKFSYRHNETIEGVRVTFPVHGRLSFKLDNQIKVNLSAKVDMNDFRNKLGSILSKGINRSDECGDRIRLKHAHVNPSSNGTANSNIRIEYEKWYCTYMDIPEIHGFSIKMVTRQTTKNIVAESGVVGDIRIEPFIRNRSEIGVNATVTRVHLVNDLARFLANTFRADLKREAQRALNKSLGQNGAVSSSLPPEIRPYVRLSNVSFTGFNGLSLHVAGNFYVRPDQIPSLYKNFLQ